MTRGVVIGKFYPPHAGHKYLIDTAQAGVDHLTVIVCSKPDHTIPGEVRAEWLGQIHPGVTIKIIDYTEETLAEDDSAAWAAATVKLLGYRPDVVYTSEEYGDTYAPLMGSKHIAVDKARVKFPVSGTVIRKSPLAHFGYLEPIVRAHFVKRVCVLGAESSGTTTLAKALSEHYKTEWVPEYGRTYLEKRHSNPVVSPWESAEFAHIAKTQNQWEDELAGQANKVLICDTNALVTAVFEEHFVGESSEKVRELSKDRAYDLYLLTDIDFPFVQDGFRVDDKTRKLMHKHFIELLTRECTPFAVLSGSPDKRLQTAVQLIDKLL